MSQQVEKPSENIVVSLSVDVDQCTGRMGGVIRGVQQNMKGSVTKELVVANLLLHSATSSRKCNEINTQYSRYSGTCTHAHTSTHHYSAVRKA